MPSLHRTKEQQVTSIVAVLINGTFLWAMLHLFFASVVSLCPAAGQNAHLIFLTASVLFTARILWRRFLHQDFNPLLYCTNFCPASQSRLKVFRCDPIHKVWDTMVLGKCIASEPTIFVADCTTSLVSDLAILLLPMPLVWQLRTSLRRKLRIMVVFAGGTL